MNDRIQFLFRHSVPAFGQWTTWILLVIAISLAVLPFEAVAGIRQEQPATIFGLLPLSLLKASWLYEAVRWVLIFSAFGWMFHRSTPITCWTTCFSFTLLCSLRLENSNHGNQIYHLTNMLLFIHAAWFQFYHLNIRQARRERVYRTTPLYPRWVFLVSVFCIGWFHTLGGLTKITHSGFDWGNGLSLQLWVHLFGWDGSPFGSLVESNRTIASIVQTSALVVLTISILAVFNRRLRFMIGVLLLGFYVAVITTFVDFGFHYNAVIVALFFLPVEPYLNDGLLPWKRTRVHPTPDADSIE